MIAKKYKYGACCRNLRAFWCQIRRLVHSAVAGTLKDPAKARCFMASLIELEKNKRLSPGKLISVLEEAAKVGTVVASTTVIKLLKRYIERIFLTKEQIERISKVTDYRAYASYYCWKAELECLRVRLYLMWGVGIYLKVSRVNPKIRGERKNGC